MKTFISFNDTITTAMQEAGVEVGRLYTVQRVVWRNGLIVEVHTFQHKFQVHAKSHGTKMLSLVGIDWALEFAM